MVNTPLDILDGYQDWRDNVPPGLAENPTPGRTDEVLRFRPLVEELYGAEPPKGFGRD